MANIVNPIRNDSIIAVTGEAVKLKVIDIGDWNMDNTPTIDIVHGLNRVKILGISGWIRDDTDTTYYNIPYGDTNIQGDLGIAAIMPTFIRLSRINAGPFDSVSFDSIAYNRGRIMIHFEDVV